MDLPLKVLFYSQHSCYLFFRYFGTTSNPIRFSRHESFANPIGHIFVYGPLWWNTFKRHLHCLYYGPLIPYDVIVVCIPSPEGATENSNISSLRDYVISSRHALKIALWNNTVTKEWFTLKMVYANVYAFPCSNFYVKSRTPWFTFDPSILRLFPLFLCHLGILLKVNYIKQPGVLYCSLSSMVQAERKLPVLRVKRV